MTPRHPSTLRLFPLVILAALLSIGEPAAQCPAPPPKLAADANADANYLSQCFALNTGGQCKQPTAPGVETALIHAQEATVTAVVPTGFTAHSVWWRASYNDPTLGWQILWVYESDKGSGVSGGTTVRFGATGLVEDAEHRFQVAFCNDTEGCYCYSAPGSTFDTDPFAADLPEPPDAADQEIEDTFTRPTTSAVPLGDALGPGWETMHTSIVDGADSGTDGDAAQLTAGGIVKLDREPANAHSYAETIVRADRTGTNADEYNIDVIARASVEGVPPNIDTKAYYVKLANDIAPDDKPSLIVGRNDDGALTALPGGTLDIATSGQSKCPSSGILPLEDADSGETGRSLPVILRIEVSDNADDSEPIVTGYVAWDCTAQNADIEDCDHVCKVGPIQDAGDPLALFNTSGDVGFCSHHKTHYFDTFRAGSVPPSP